MCVLESKKSVDCRTVFGVGERIWRGSVERNLKKATRSKYSKE
jgi:hypothetical protein